jgi:urea ABC transporter permease protein UrtB
MQDLVATQAINLVYAVTTLAVLSLGLAVIFGLLGVLNLAHGEFIMIGAYCAVVVRQSGWPFLTAIPLALLVCGVLGYLIEVAIIRRLYRRPFDTLVATWGLSLLLRKSVEAIFGLNYRNVDLPLVGTFDMLGVSYPAYRVAMIAVSASTICALVVWYGNSRTGLRIKAMTGNPELAQSLGVSVKRLASGTFVVGTCLAALGGVMIAPLAPVYPYMGLDYVLRTFFVIVVGGLGSVLGLAYGALAIGGLDSAVSAVSGAAYGYLSVIVLAILFLWLRPRGIYARG